MTIQLNSAVRDQWANDLNDDLGADAKLLIYSGPVPATTASTATGLLLSSGARGNAAGWGSVTAGVLTAGAITSDSDAAATGTAGYFRWLDADNTAVFQGTITATGGGGDLTMADIQITQHDTVAVSSWTLTMPGA